MDISLLSKMIVELILKQDQVGLPGIGTFVAEMVPASFSDKGYTINPPYRRLNFYPANLEEDALAQFYANANGVDDETAKNTITQFLADLKLVLMNRRTISLPGLGRLRATKENNFFFVPDENLDIFPEGYGLPSISLKTHVETPEEPIPFEIIPEITPEIIPETVNAAETIQEEPEPKVKIEAEVKTEPKVEVKEQEYGPKLEPDPKHFRWWIPVLVIIGVAFVALCAFMVLATVTPDFIDSILYTPEELEIINY